MSDLTPGQDLSRRFELLRPLGRGGMAEVWLVHDRELDEEVAAKIVNAGVASDVLERLQREFRALRRLGHAHIVPAFDFHRGDRHHVLTMAYVEGQDLRTLRGAPPGRLLQILVPIADAIAYAHSKGVVHRDLKATNVLLDAEGHPHLLDFGIAGVLDEVEPAARSGGGSRYNVSPQQLDGERSHPGDDLYAFGVLLYELVTGAPPFWPDISDERIRTELPTAFHSSHPLPAGLEELTRSLLAKSAEQRPAMSDVRDRLESLQQPATVRSGIGGALPRAVRLTPPPRARSVRSIAPPAQAEIGASETGRRSGRRVRNLLIGTTLVGSVLFVLLVLLPWLRDRTLSREPDPMESTGEASPSAGEGVEKPDDRELTPEQHIDAAARAEARESMREALPWRTRLAERGVDLWGGEELDRVERQLAIGDDAMGAAEYSRARDAYAEALVGLEILDTLALDTLEDALRDGSESLAAWDVPGAQQAFELALAIGPGNELAARGLRRAESLDEVRRLLDRGRTEERAARLEPARELFARAARLDPLCLEAQKASARIETQLSTDRFAQAMSRGLSELKAGNYVAARDGFETAMRLRPDSLGAVDGLAQVDSAAKLEAIGGLRRDAGVLENEERWAEAAERFAAVLQIDSSIRFAQEGEQRARSRAELDTRLEFHITNPQRLSAQAVFDEADRLLERARKTQPAGPRLRGQIGQLDAQVDSYATKFAVRLDSDDRTEVTVYRVGPLGAFKTKELQLRPGTYTVVGSRLGYRDVRLILIVNGEQSPEPLTVRCVEKI